MKSLILFLTLLLSFCGFSQTYEDEYLGYEWMHHITINEDSTVENDSIIGEVYSLPDGYIGQLSSKYEEVGDIKYIWTKEIKAVGYVSGKIEVFRKVNKYTEVEVETVDLSSLFVVTEPVDDTTVVVVNDTIVSDSITLEELQTELQAELQDVIIEASGIITAVKNLFELSSDTIPDSFTLLESMSPVLQQRGISEIAALSTIEEAQSYVIRGEEIEGYLEALKKLLDMGKIKIHT